MAFLTSQVLLSASDGVGVNFSAPFDSGSMGDNKVLIVGIVYEHRGDPGVTGVAYGGLPMMKIADVDANLGTDSNESGEAWIITNPPQGVNSISMSNDSTSHDIAIMAAVYDDVDQNTPVANVVSKEFSASDVITTSVDKATEDDDIFWMATQNRAGTGSNLSAIADNTRREHTLTTNGPGFTSAIGDRTIGVGEVAVGANQDVTNEFGLQEAFIIAVALKAAVDDGSGDGGGDDGGGDDGGGDGPVGNFVEDIRVENCIIQQKKANESAYVNVHDLTLCGGSGGGGGSVTVEGRAVTTRQLGYIPDSDPAVNAQNLQAFINTVASDGVVGIIEAGVWDIDRQINLRDGLRLRGEGMQRTIINCPTASWLDSGNFTAFKLEAVSSLNKAGVQLSDFKVIGADKNATDNGGLIRLQGLEDGIVERLWLEDGSSYGLFIAGYGLGGFTNDIHDDFWNSTFRVVVRDCVTRRGQIGMGCEGGAEGVLFLHNTINSLRDDGSFGLHGFRNPSGYNVRHTGNRVFGCRSAFTIDREKHIEINGNYIHNCRQGVSIGSFRDSDPEVSKDVKITSNYFHCVEENDRSAVAITDSWLPQGHVEGVVIANNIISQGNISLREVRRAVVTGNVSPFGNADIVTASDATGLVTNNLMGLSNSASGVVDGGNNIS